MKLIVTYEMDGISKVTEVDELCKVRDGFWIDGSGNFCLSCKAEIYILPHMIHRIHKEHEEGYSETVVDAEFKKEES
jgi:hypothetical protein